MKREVYSAKVVKTTLNITQNQVDSVRKNNYIRTACRVYENGCIGISGFFGEPADEHWAAAEENLKLQIPYAYPIEENKQRLEDHRKECLTEKEFLARSEDMLAKLHEQNPNFIFSNKLFMCDTTETLSNDSNLRYEYRDHFYQFFVVFKHKDSNAVFDGGLGCESRTFDAETFLNDSHKLLAAYEKELPLPEEQVLPVVLSFGAVGDKILEALSAEALGKKTSVFAGKEGQKLFSDQFTLYIDRSKENCSTAFFDMEGSTLPDDRINLIENGVLKRGLCDKKSAAEFGFENTACGEGSYDDVPSLGCPGVGLVKSDKTLAELLGGKRAILIDTMSGGDCTAEGNFASPVQLAYLLEDGQPVGRLPEFNLSGNLYTMFGEGYLGVSSDKPYFNNHYLVLQMKVN